VKNVIYPLIGALCLVTVFCWPAQAWPVLLVVAGGLIDAV
jgi:hypothetical protein